MNSRAIYLSVAAAALLTCGALAQQPEEHTIVLNESIGCQSHRPSTSEYLVPNSLRPPDCHTFSHGDRVYIDLRRPDPELADREELCLRLVGDSVCYWSYDTYLYRERLCCIDDLIRLKERYPDWEPPEGIKNPVDREIFKKRFPDWTPR